MMLVRSWVLNKIMIRFKTTNLLGMTRVLLQQAGCSRPIRSKHGPAFRILGFFEEVDDIDIPQYQSLGELFIATEGDWRYIGDEPTTDIKMEIKIAKDVLSSFETSEQDRQNRLDSRIANDHTQITEGNNKVSGSDDTDVHIGQEALPSGDTTEANNDTSEANNVTDEQALIKCPGVLSAQSVRGQNYAVVGIITHEDKALMKPMGTRDTEDQCIMLMNVLAKKNDSVDYYVVQMYEWCYISTIIANRCNGKISFKYREEQLNDIMQHAASEEVKKELVEENMKKLGVPENEYIKDIDKDIHECDQESKSTVR